MRNLSIDLDTGNSLVVIEAVQVQHAGILGVDRSVVIIEEGWHGVMEGGIDEEYRMAILDDGYCAALLSYRRRTGQKIDRPPGMQEQQGQEDAVEMLRWPYSRNQVFPDWFSPSTACGCMLRQLIVEVEKGFRG